MKEHVWIPSRGKNISAMVHLPEGFGPQRPLVICCHGFTGDKVGNSQLTRNLALALADSGFGVLRFDYLGSGESDGDFAVETSVAHWQEDLRNVLNWAAGQPQLASSPWVLYGHSLGGLIALSHPDDADRITARIVFAPVIHATANFRDIIFGPDLWQRSRSGETLANFFDKGFRLESQFVQDLERNDYHGTAAAAAYRTPLLIVHGTKDVVVPPAGSQELYTAYAGEKELVELEMDHVASGSQELLYDVIAKWLQRRA
ncbi:MAG TPA: alpha/beta fold hydrolase [Patescibacteria group bacterium]|nr:alpha/beta fold hydrolase [Patescibacteria group bacterium]